MPPPPSVCLHPSYSITVAHHHGHSSRVPDSINSTTIARRQWQHTVTDSQTMIILFSSVRHKAQQTDEK